ERATLAAPSSVTVPALPGPTVLLLICAPPLSVTFVASTNTLPPPPAPEAPAKIPLFSPERATLSAPSSVTVPALPDPDVLLLIFAPPVTVTFVADNRSTSPPSPDPEALAKIPLPSPERATLWAPSSLTFPPFPRPALLEIWAPPLT